MKQPKKYSKEWLKHLVEEAHKVEDTSPMLMLLLKDLDDYVANLEKRYSNCGKSKSEAKKASSRANGKLGGKPKKVAKCEQ